MKFELERYAVPTVRFGGGSGRYNRSATGQERTFVFLQLEVLMRIGIQIAFASLLIAAASSLVLLWLSLLALTYDSQSGIMPWTGAGAILFGLLFVAIGAIVGVPGIFWANSLARRVPPKWQRIAQAPRLNAHSLAD